MVEYVFGYGSLMNPASLARTVGAEKHLLPAALFGYERICNKIFGLYAFMNIREHEAHNCSGVIFPVTESELAALDVREEGYVRVDVTGLVKSEGLLSDDRVFTYVGTPPFATTEKVLRSYLETCLRGVPMAERQFWLSGTVIPFGIEEDLENPVYTNAAL